MVLGANADEFQTELTCRLFQEQQALAYESHMKQQINTHFVVNMEEESVNDSELEGQDVPYKVIFPEKDGS